MKQRKKTEKEKPQSTKEQWNNFQQPKKVQLGPPKKREKEGDRAKIEEIVAEIFPNFIKIIKHIYPRSPMTPKHKIQEENSTKVYHNQTA